MGYYRFHGFDTYICDLCDNWCLNNYVIIYLLGEANELSELWSFIVVLFFFFFLYKYKCFLIFNKLYFINVVLKTMIWKVKLCFKNKVIHLFYNCFCIKTWISIWNCLGAFKLILRYQLKWIISELQFHMIYVLKLSLQEICLWPTHIMCK